MIEDPRLGESYWLIGYGKVWVTNVMEIDGKVFMIRTEDVKKKDMGCRYLYEFEEIEND